MAQDYKTDFMTTNQRLVAFFDIMGFKDFVFRNTHETVQGRMDIISKSLKQFDRVQKDIKGTETIRPDLFKYVLFSDSILFISNDDTLFTSKVFMLYCAFFYSDCMVANIPIKGAIAHGIFTADIAKSHYFGQPIIDAYQLQDELHFYGIALHHSMDKFLSEKNYLKDTDINRVITNREIPLKSGKVKHNIIKLYVDYAIRDREKWINNFYKTVSGITRKYVDNTMEFLNSIKDELPQVK